MYQPVIGLEVHIELKTKTKMFCSCPNNPDEKRANFNVCPICLGHPGTLPLVNEEAVKQMIKVGLALDCQIAHDSKFDRKNYFYPDLPKGYQISQCDQPLCLGGGLFVNEHKINLEKIHLEEDAGKLIHSKEEDYSLVDFNRAGLPLMELVTKPEITSAKEAREFAENLNLMMRYLGASEANLEKGEMRVDVNISLKKETAQQLGTKVEIKNLNSFRAIERAVEYEITRQSKILEAGEKVIQETRGWDESQNITISQREKGEASDNRCFADPDLPPLHLTQEYINEVKKEIPELPQERRKRFEREYKLAKENINIFVNYKELGDYFEKVASQFNLGGDFVDLVKLTANYLITDLQGLAKGNLKFDDKFLIKSEDFAQFILLIKEGKISSKIAKIVLEEMFEQGTSPSQIIEEKGLVQISDEGELEKIAQEIIINNPKVVEDYKKGKENVYQYLVGQLMAKTKGKADPSLAQKVIQNLLTNIE